MHSRERGDRMFRVAIIGGGIGGLCAALFIHRQCGQYDVQIDVYEQASQYKEIGAGVGVGVNAARLLHRLGIGNELNAIAGSRDGIWISFRRYDDGKDIITVPQNDKSPIRQAPVQRSEFLDLLVKTVKDRRAARLHTKKHCVQARDNDHEITLKFKDGTESTHDFVIGCDGIHSNLRSQYSTDNPHYSGRIAYRGLVKIKDIKSWWPLQSYSASWLGPDKHFLVFPIARNELLNIVAFVSQDECRLNGLKESWTATGRREDLLQDYKDFDETVQRLITLMPEDPSKWVLNDREPLHQWVFAKGKVVLLGDAAHAMLPHQGAGAGQAIEDGYILSRALKDFLSTDPGDQQSLEEWMKLYQQVRLPRAQKAQATARDAGNVYEMQTKEMKGKSYNDCLPLVRDSLKDRMKWVWSADIDQAYDEARKTLIPEYPYYE